MTVRLKISRLLIDFDTRFPDYVIRRCSRYIASSADDDDASGRILRLRASDEDIERADAGLVGPMEAELYAMTIPLSGLLPEMDRLMMHGVAVSCDGLGFVFTAGSGVGKSTHAFLWQKYLGKNRVSIINGDKPILWFREDGDILACGTPWSGKEHLDENVCIPLKGVCLLDRLENHPGKGPGMMKASREETFDFMMHQVFLPDSPAGQIKTFRLLEKLYEQVPVYNLFADMSRESVIASSSVLLPAAR